MPYPNEHAARLHDPGDFKEKPDWGDASGGAFRRTADGTIFGKIKVPDTVDVLWGQLKTQSGKDAAPQALRFPISSWTEAQSRKWLDDNGVKFILFEPAKPGGKQSLRMPASACYFSAADCKLAQVEANGPPRFRMVAHSGKPMDHPYFGKFAVDLAGINIPRQVMPALVEHDRRAPAGFTDKIGLVVGDGLVAEGALLKMTEDGRRVASMMAEGFPFEASVFIPPSKIEDVPTGEEAEVNGYTLAGPATIFRKCTLREVSFCALGADEHTSARALAQGDEITAEVTRASVAPVEATAQTKESEAMDLKELTLAQLKEARADIVTELAATVTTTLMAELKAVADVALAAAVKAERERAVQIAADAAEHSMFKLAADLIREGKDANACLHTIKDARLAELTRLAPKPPGASVGIEAPPPPPAQLTVTQRKLCAQLAISEKDYLARLEEEKHQKELAAQAA